MFLGRLMALAADKAPKLDLEGWFTLRRAHEGSRAGDLATTVAPGKLGQVLAQRHAPPDSLFTISPSVSVLLVVAEFLAEQDAAGLRTPAQERHRDRVAGGGRRRPHRSGAKDARLDDRALGPRLYEDAT